MIDVWALWLNEFRLVIDVFTLALFVFNASILICWDADDWFRFVIETNADALNNSKFCVSINKLAVVVSMLFNLLFAEEVNVLYPVLILSWDAVNAFKAVISLPLTSGNIIPNVEPLPFVKVKVWPLRDAVVKLKLADVNKLAVALFKLLTDVFKLWVVVFKLDIEIFTDALLVFNALTLLFKLAVVVSIEVNLALVDDV